MDEARDILTAVRRDYDRAITHLHSLLKDIA